MRRREPTPPALRSQHRRKRRIGGRQSGKRRRPLWLRVGVRETGSILDDRERRAAKRFENSFAIVLPSSSPRREREAQDEMRGSSGRGSHNTGHDRDGASGKWAGRRF